MMTGTVCLEEKTISIQNFGIWGLMGARGKICRRKCYIWNRRTWFAYSLCNFYGATMMIEGSLLLFIFGQKMEVPFWAKIWRFWGLNRGLKLNLSVITSKRPAKIMESSPRWRILWFPVARRGRCHSGIFSGLPEWQRPRRATGKRRNLQCHTGHGVTLPGCGGGLGLGVGLAGCRFLCAGKIGKYIAPFTEHEWSGPQQHPAMHGGVTFPGIMFMTWRAQGVINGWLLVFPSMHLEQ